MTAQQLKKLLYNKKFIDAPDGDGHIARWVISPWKVLIIAILFVILAIFVYGWFFTENRAEFFGNIMFYSIVLILIVVGLWITAKKAIDFKQRLTYFLIAFILLWVLYWILGVVLGAVGLLQFHMGGPTLWIILSLLALLGAKRIDGELTRDDLFFSGLVLLVFLGANIPMNSNGGFLANVDKIISDVFKYLKL